MNKSRRMYLKMILSSLLRRRSRMIIALLSIAIGSTIISGMITIYYDIPRQLGREFRSYGANFILLPDGDTKIDHEIYKKAQKIISAHTVVGEAPYRYETTKINQKPYILAGTDFSGVRKNSPFWHIDGEWPDIANENEVMIGKEVAKTLNLDIGDTFKAEGVKYGRNVVSSKVSDSADDSKQKDNIDDYYSVKLKVVGIITTGGAEEGFIFLQEKLLNSILEDERRLDAVECSIEASTEELEKMAAKLKQELPGVLGRPVRRLTQSQDIVLGKLQVLVLLVDVIILLLTMISVLTTMIAVVTERRKEIGLKKALGAMDSSIISEFLGEGVALGFLGGLIGVIFGYIFAQRVSLNVFGRSINFSWWVLPLTLSISVGITVISSIWPVKQAAKIDPALVLRGE